LKKISDENKFLRLSARQEREEVEKKDENAACPRRESREKFFFDCLCFSGISVASRPGNLYPPGFEAEEIPEFEFFEFNRNGLKRH
jgi:hypothetical protein